MKIMHPLGYAVADTAMISLDAADTASEPGWVVTARTVSDMDVAPERTGMYSQRVLAVTTRRGSFQWL